MKAVKLIYNNIERSISVVCLALMVIGLTYNTIGRYFFHSAVSWMEEICAYMMIWLVYTSVSYAVQQKAHICIDSVLGLYPKRLAPYIIVFGMLVWAVFSTAIVVIGTAYVIGLYEKGGRAISIPLPMWIVYAIIPFGHAFVTIRLFEDIGRRVINLIRNVDEKEIVGNAVENVEILSDESGSPEDKQGGAN